MKVEIQVEASTYTNLFLLLEEAVSDIKKEASSSVCKGCREWVSKAGCKVSGGSDTTQGISDWSLIRNTPKKKTKK